MSQLRGMTTAAIGLLILGASPACAQEVTGVWLRENGESKVRFAKCGEAICGTVAWLKSPETSSSKLGQRVFYDMKPAGAGAWEGKAFNPEDGKTYTGKMTLSGDALKTAGCVFGGIICRSVSWSRAN